jgi:hypothetical protein
MAHSGVRCDAPRCRLSEVKPTPFSRADHDGAAECSIAIHLSQQFRQPCNIDGDPSRLVFRRDLGLPCFGIALAATKVRERQSLSLGHRGQTR